MMPKYGVSVKENFGMFSGAAAIEEKFSWMLDTTKFNDV